MAIERIAHRGARTERPENTIAAFERAFARGATGIELDVHSSSDGVIVVHHDPELADSVSGALRAIAEMTWEEIRATGSRSGVSVPRLTEVLTVVPPGATAYVEIKGSRIEQPVADVIAASSARCAAHSFDHATIDRVAAIAPNLPRGLLFESAESLESLESDVKRASARDVWPHHSLVDSTLVARARAVGARVIAWTVNSRADVERLAGLGIDGICTDDVRTLDDLR
jgi:glycerophosphoryl diester phosphodiesterase